MLRTDDGLEPADKFRAGDADFDQAAIAVAKKVRKALDSKRSIDALLEAFGNESTLFQLLERFKAILPEEELPALMEALNGYPRIAIQIFEDRADYLASIDPTLAEGLEPIPWTENGFWMPPNTRVPQEHIDSGRVNIQDAASQLACETFNFQPGQTVLDLASGFGIKTNQLRRRLEAVGGGVVIANEPNERRQATAQEVIGRYDSFPNVDVRYQQQDGRELPLSLNESVDHVLIDAPCTGSGLLAKSTYRVLRNWDQAALESMTQLQRDLIVAGYDCLRPGGSLVYATCSLDWAEDEAVLQHLLTNHPEARQVDIVSGAELPYPGVEQFQDQSVEGSIAEQSVRLWPHLHETIGFFVAKFEKPE